MADPLLPWRRFFESFLRAKGMMIHLVIRLSILSMLWNSGTAMAQPNSPRKDIDTPGLIIEAEAGWGGFVDRTYPVPVSFLLRNDTKQDIQGILRLKDSINGHEVSLGEVVVSPGTTRRFTSVQSVSNWYDCYATLARDQKILWQRSLNLNTGKSFTSGYNHLLFVDNNERKLDLPTETPNVATIATAMNDSAIPGQKGRPIRSLTAKPWQIPNHPGPLLAVQSIVFHEGTMEKDLNAAQWKAVAQWVCEGGLLFVDNQSREVIERLVKSSPLSPDLATQSGSLAVRRMGLGEIREYVRPLMSSEGVELRTWIATTVGNWPRNQINSFHDLPNFQSVKHREADRYRTLIITLFSLYTLVTGGGALFLFRLNQKQIALFTIVMVCITSLIAAIFGGSLRLSKGDLRWMTITAASSTGLIQVGGLEVQSTGNSRARVTIKGENVDQQYIGILNTWFYQGNQRPNYSPFAWQANQLPAEENAYQINVPMSPFGRRRCHVNGFQSGTKQVEIELKFHFDDPAAQALRKSSGTVPAGKFSLKLKNHLPFDISDSFLLIGATSAVAQASTQPNQVNGTVYNNVYWGNYQINTEPVEGLIDLYHRQSIRSLNAGGSCEIDFPANFKPPEHLPQYNNFWPFQGNLVPRLSQVGTTRAWIMGKLSKSPIIEIDEDRSDFVPDEGTHLFVQEIDLEDLPEALAFTPSPTDKEQGSAPNSK